MKIMILGASGMLGNAAFRLLSEDPPHAVVGTGLVGGVLCRFGEAVTRRLLTGVDIEKSDSLVRAFATVHPQVGVNCIGLVKQLAEVVDPLKAVPINTLFPHELATLCQATGARLVHISTDCVF